MKRWWNPSWPTLALGGVFGVGSIAAVGGCHPDSQVSPSRDAGGDIGFPTDAGTRTDAHADLPQAADVREPIADAADAQQIRQDAQSSEVGQVCFPDCVLNIGMECMRLGQSCVKTTLASGDVVQCYANGVKALVTQMATTVRKPNGDLCFRIDDTASGFDYYDASGALLASLEVMGTVTKYLARCADGTVKYVDLMAPECAATVAAMIACTDGACTW